MTSDIVLDHDREARIGVDEAILCSGKSTRQLINILSECRNRARKMLLTRLSRERFEQLSAEFELDFDEESGTAFYGSIPVPEADPTVGLVSAGSSDLPVTREADRTLEYLGVKTKTFYDIGVAGIWRLRERLDAMRDNAVLIVVAGMDGALPSVIGGLMASPIIAVPTSTGYGIARDGEAALHAVLTSCAPGVTVVNIDNGYGAAVAAYRVVSTMRKASEQL